MAQTLHLVCHKSIPSKSACCLPRKIRGLLFCIRVQITSSRSLGDSKLASCYGSEVCGIIDSFPSAESGFSSCTMSTYSTCKGYHWQPKLCSSS